MKVLVRGQLIFWLPQTSDYLGAKVINRLCWGLAINLGWKKQQRKRNWLSAYHKLEKRRGQIQARPLDFSSAECYTAFRLPKWRNGRRTWLKIKRLIPCGFESHLRHDKESLQSQWLQGFFVLRNINIIFKNNIYKDWIRTIKKMSQTISEFRSKDWISLVERVTVYEKWWAIRPVHRNGNDSCDFCKIFFAYACSPFPSW